VVFVVVRLRPALKRADTENAVLDVTGDLDERAVGGVVLVLRKLAPL
jgi:hypothetical protein